MTQVVHVGPLPERATEAATAFYASTLPAVPPRPGQDLVLVFPPAPHDHHAWRLAVVQDLARAAAPARVNGVVGTGEEAIAATLTWLERAPGVTGQLLSVHDG